MHDYDVILDDRYQRRRGPLNAVCSIDMQYRMPKVPRNRKYEVRILSETKNVGECIESEPVL
jgi:hypothetical protein